MFSFGRQRRQTIRNPWTKRRNNSSTAVMGGLAVFLLAIVLGMGWLLSQALQQQPSPSDLVLPPPNSLRRQEVPPRNPPPLPPKDANPKQQQLQPNRPPPQPVAKRSPPPQEDEPKIPLDQDQVGVHIPTTIDAFREAFEARYGAEVTKILREKALQSFGSVEATAHRFLNALAQGRPFRLGFAGYSITVGRGNFYHQSYPIQSNKHSKTECVHHAL